MNQRPYTLFVEGTGLGIDDDILDAYTFIMINYVPGDEIFIFGFSRGAFTARVLAGLIINLGIFIPTRAYELKDAFKAYRTSKEKWETYLITLHKNLRLDLKAKRPLRTQAAKIQIIGCWDTVGSVGIPVIQPVYDFATRSSGVYDPSLFGGPSPPFFAEIKNAFHALALDECRRPFSPTLWYLPENSKSGYPSSSSFSRSHLLMSCHGVVNLQQCWFPGVHTNVGGGYADTALADLALAWMIDHCSPFLSFNPNHLDLIFQLHQHPDTLRTRRREKEGVFDKVYQGWGRGHLYDSFKESLYTVQVQGWRYRRPGAYGGKEGAEGLSIRTGEVIHASVRERWYAELQPTWKPESLKGFGPRQNASGVWEWFKAGKNVMPDIVIEEASMREKGFEARLRNDVTDRCLFVHS